MSIAATADAHGHTSTKNNFIGMAVGAIGVVYGDIGTSPLYAFREALKAVMENGQPLAREDVFGVLSLILWAMTIIVTLKYVLVLLRADNHGEGGPLALMSLARSGFYSHTMIFLLLGMASSALFYGDSIITPAISVLSAVEGMKVVTPAMTPFVLPITAVIILGLFMFQSKGTAKVSTLFGPIMVAWFLTLGVLGLQHIGDNPDVVKSFNPYYAFKLISTHSGLAFVILGAVFLSVTGAEALYADLGHFGKAPIQAAWIWFIFPCLALNYLGQGAMVLHDPTTIDNPFFKLAGEKMAVPLVIFATAATIIASQAVITGTFSLARQAANLGMLPRLVVKHTSDVHSGQIYLPQINYMLMIGVLALVFLFKSSDSLAAAYGISVTGTMMLDAVLVLFVIWKLWEWPLLGAVLFVTPFLLTDITFFSSNLTKIAQGAWMPLLVASILFSLMLTWVQGTIILTSRARKRDVKIEKFINTFAEKYGNLPRVSGTAFFMASDPNYAPPSLIQNLKHNKILHEKNIILSIKFESIPYVAVEQRSIVTKLNDDFSVVVLRFGYKDEPDVQEELIRLNRNTDVEVKFDWEKTSVFLSRRSLRSHPRYGLPLWQDFIYIWLHKNAGDPSDFYKLPMGRVIEIGRHSLI